MKNLRVEPPAEAVRKGLIFGMLIALTASAAAVEDVIYRGAFDPVAQGNLERTWRLVEHFADGRPPQQQLADDLCAAADVRLSQCIEMAPRLVWGNLGSAPPGEPDVAHMELYSNTDGQTFWGAVVAPDWLDHDAMGGFADYESTQWYRVTSQRPSLKAVITASEVFVASFEGPSPHICPVQGGNVCVDKLRASVNVSVSAFRDILPDRQTDTLMFFHSGGFMQAHGFYSDWTTSVWSDAAAYEPLWGSSIREIIAPHYFQIDLTGPKVVDIPIADFEIGTEFALRSRFSVSAINEDPGENYARAYFRDPIEAGGVRVEYEGLEPVDGPAGVILPADTGELPCAGPADPDAGSIEFVDTDRSIVEFGIGSFVIPIERVGGASGAISARIRSLSGTARQVADFVPVNELVRFADGETGVRGLQVSLVEDDDVEPDESFTLQLSDPGGCASLGDNVTLEIEIIDDDAEAPTFALGGVVTGLEGTGLVLQNLQADDCPIDSGGPFEFCRRYETGTPYRITVKTQPANPLQDCDIINGEGTIEGADVTSVEVRCNTRAPGGLDMTFGDNGRATGLLLGLEAMALQSDGSIVAVSGGTVGRFTADGAPDSTFGAAGERDIVYNGSPVRALYGVGVQADDRIVVVGEERSTGTPKFFAARLFADGDIDPSFGSNGFAVVPIGVGAVARDVAIQNNDGIVMVGHALRDVPGSDDSDFAVARLTPDGLLDGSFGQGGMLLLDIAGKKDVAQHVALQADGRIVLTGTLGGGFIEEEDFVAVRLMANGAADPTFGGAGNLVDITGERFDWISDLSHAVAVQPDGKVLLVGQGSKSLDPPARVPAFETRRYLSDGRRDPTFGVDGRVYNQPFPMNSALGLAIGVLPDGRIVVAGEVLMNGGTTDFALGILTVAGAADTSFADDGALAIDFFGDSDRAKDLIVLPGGGVLVGGDVRDGFNYSAGIVRLIP